MTTPKRIFLVLKNPEWDNLKPEKIHLFGKSYATDGSEKLVTDVLHEALEYMQKHMIYDEAYPFFYWTYDGQGSFIDFWVTVDLLGDTRAFTDFKTWLERTVNTWAALNKLSVKTEYDKPREFVLKFIITILLTASTSAPSPSDTPT